MYYIYSIKMILEKSYMLYTDIHQIYIDFKQALSGLLEEKPNEFIISEKLIQLLIMILIHSHRCSKIKMESDLSQGFQKMQTLRQVFRNKIRENISQ